MTISAPTTLGYCRLQRTLGIEEACRESCLLYERAEGQGCLLRGAESTPPGIARSLLKRAGRRVR